MKNTAFLLTSIIAFCITAVNAQDNSWGIGLRVGAFSQRNTFTNKMTLTETNPNVSSGFYYQAFLNKEVGKNWMVEANLGYNSFSYEYLRYYPVSQPVDVYAYTHNKTNVYSLQLNLRYAFWKIPQLNWKHYAGVSLAVHRNIEHYYSFGNVHDPNVIERENNTYTLYHNFLGPEYFGKIALNKKLSIQYLFGYNFSTQTLTLNGKDNKSNSSIVYDGPTIHRFNMNFGIGYQL